MALTNFLVDREAISLAIPLPAEDFNEVRLLDNTLLTLNVGTQTAAHY